MHLASLGGHEHDFRKKLAPSVCGTYDAMAWWQDVPKRHPHTHTNWVKWATHRCLSEFGVLNWIHNTNIDHDVLRAERRR